MNAEQAGHSKSAYSTIPIRADSRPLAGAVASGWGETGGGSEIGVEETEQKQMDCGQCAAS